MKPNDFRTSLTSVLLSTSPSMYDNTPSEMSTFSLQSHLQREQPTLEIVPSVALHSLQWISGQFKSPAVLRESTYHDFPRSILSSHLICTVVGTPISVDS